MPQKTGDRRVKRVAAGAQHFGGGLGGQPVAGGDRAFHRFPVMTFPAGIFSRASFPQVGAQIALAGVGQNRQQRFAARLFARRDFQHSADGRAA